MGEELDPGLLAYLEQTNKSLNDLTNEIQFLLALTEKSLLIQIKQAYLLERISNLVYEIEDTEAITRSQAEAVFQEIRELFEDQRRIMTGGQDDKPS